MPDTSNEQLISWIKVPLILAGLWNLKISDNVFIKKCYFLYSLIMRTGCFFFWVSLVAESVRLIVKKYEMSIIIPSVSLTITEYKMVAKLLIYLKHDTLNLFGKIIEMEREVWICTSEEIKSLYRKNILYVKIATSFIGFYALLSVSILQISGIIGTLHIKTHNALTNDTVEPHLMYPLILPFNKTQHLHWHFSMQLLCAWNGVLYYLLTELIFIVILVYAAGQLQILQVRFRNFLEPNFSIDATDEEIRAKIFVLKGLVREHQNTIDFIEDFNDRMKYGTMIEFLVTSVDIASVCLGLLKMSSISQSLWFLSYFFAITMQLLFIGWSCNEIKIQSGAIGTALYESKWYCLNDEGKKITQIVMLRTNRLLMMTIGPFGPMTTNSIVLVMKAAYSYINIMRKN
ncbi:hypothetical protein ABEB36_004266 [Hypothenemus hampei]|uniref:Odorant receptor n=1 Tax=Hypothenemus hampei TaxID=57062 RepID=A0ABD1F2S8_HYPHA